MKKVNQPYLLMFIVVLSLGWVQSVPAEQESISLPGSVEDSLNYLLDLVSQKGSSLDTARIIPLINFAGKKSKDSEKIKPARRKSGKGVCIRTEVKAPLERILRYAYNPEIPSFVVCPSVLRLSGWYPESEIVTGGIRLWEKLGDLEKPLFLWGKEFEVNTPDSFSGAYYRYDLDRLLGLMKHKNGRVLISVSKMLNKSQVGKKAVIIDDKNWNYFYSGIEGLNMKIFGGMDTFMYDSESVLIYYQEDSSIRRCTVLLFKWLRAGWSGINVVQPSHINDGCVRFVQGMKAVLESKGLPISEAFVGLVNYITELSDSELDSKIGEYSTSFERIAQSHKNMSNPENARIIAGGGYAGVLSPEERVGVLILEGLKRFVGKPTLVNLEFFPLPTEIPMNRDFTFLPVDIEAVDPTAKPTDK